MTRATIAREALVVSRREAKILTALGGTYGLITVVWGFLFAMGAGHGGPSFFLLLPGAPVLIPVFGSIAAVFLWTWVGSLLGKARSGRLLLAILAVHYIGVAMLVIFQLEELRTEMHGDTLLLGAAPYLIGQAVMWLFLGARRLATGV